MTGQQPSLAEQERIEVMNLMQLVCSDTLKINCHHSPRLLRRQEALGLGRRKDLSMTDYKENRQYVPQRQLENVRRINQKGSQDCLAAKQFSRELGSWNGTGLDPIDLAVQETDIFKLYIMKSRMMGQWNKISVTLMKDWARP